MSQHFLHYTITSALEQRAAGQTYLAHHDHEATHTVVLKIFQAQGFTSIIEQEKFLQESEKFSTLSSNHIVSLLEAGLEGDQAYIVSKYMPNGSLRVRLDRAYPQRLPFQQAMTIITQIGQGLSYLHARYLVHGQVKPEHILFDANGRALLADPYCFTKPAPWSSNNENASDAYRYLAPEQFDGTYNALCDQYALCCVAYELLTGRPPFTLRDPQALEEQQKYVLPGAISPILPDLAPSIEQAILKGLAKEPGHRHADIATLLSAMQINQATPASDLPLPRAKRRTKSLAPSIPIAPQVPTKKTALEQLASASTSQKLPINENPFSPSRDIHTPKTGVIIPPMQIPDNEQYLDDLAPKSTMHLQGKQQPLKDSIDIPQQNFPDRNQYLEDSIDVPQQNFPDRNKRLDEIFNTPAKQSQEASIASTLDELLQEMAIEDELLLPENTIYDPPTKQYDIDKHPATPMSAEDEYEDIVLPSYGEQKHPELTPSSYGEQKYTDVTPPSYERDDYEDSRIPSYGEIEDSTPLPSSEEPDDDVAASSLTAAALASTVPLTQAPSESVRNGRVAKLSANLSKNTFVTSLVSMPSRKGVSRRVLLGIVAMLLMIGCLILYSVLAVAIPSSSASALFAPLTTPTPKPTVDSLGFLPTVVATIGPVATPMPTPKPTPKPKPKPTPKPTATPTVPVYIPPAPTAPPQPTATPKPALLFSQPFTLQATSPGALVSETAGLSVTNFRIETDISTTGDGGGVMFRTSNANGYRFRVGTDGTYDLVTPAKTLSSGSNSAIKQGNGASNHVTIVAKGTSITISINSTVVIGLKDSTYSSGDIGVMATDMGNSTTTNGTLSVYSY